MSGERFNGVDFKSTLEMFWRVFRNFGTDGVDSGIHFS
jgi:hypothetical protein